MATASDGSPTHDCKPGNTFAGLLASLPEIRRAARRASRVPEEADDLLQDALLELLRAGRQDLGRPENLAWLHGVLRNLGAMAARTAVRRRIRDDLWSGQHPLEELPAWWSAHDRELEAILEALPIALRRVAHLALSGHDRQEIAWLLGLRDDTLRQRISALRRRLADLDRDLVGFALDAGRASRKEVDLPPRWTSDLLRRALLPVARFSRGAGVSDPDGHLMVLSMSSPRKFPPIPPHIHEPPGNNKAEPSTTRRATQHPERRSASPSHKRSLP